ncbi:MAG: hypothetical protein Q7V62_14645 [Actinomycetota bacterium]|nr:hypothetical protein [Actinomycetota bacterium]
MSDEWVYTPYEGPSSRGEWDAAECYLAQRRHHWDRCYSGFRFVAWPRMVMITVGTFTDDFSSLVTMTGVLDVLYLCAD